MKAIARNYNASEQHFKAADILLTILASSFEFASSGTITKRHKHCMIFISDGSGGGSLTLNGTVTIRTARTQQAYRIPFEVTSYEWNPVASFSSTNNLIIIGFN
jgi:hypothetical protein